MEIWLRTNVRAVLFGMALPVLAGIAGLILCLGLPGRETAPWMRIAGIILVAVSAAVLVALAAQLRQPRLAYHDRHLLVWLRSGAPERVPIEVVECFWIGKSASLLPGKQHRRTETAALVIRLAEKATEWRDREVKLQLGQWCGGYITIRGTWCEPLSIDLVNRLNQRLADVAKATSA